VNLVDIKGYCIFLPTVKATVKGEVSKRLVCHFKVFTMFKFFIGLASEGFNGNCKVTPLLIGGPSKPIDLMACLIRGICCS
jgi:hypothetical protein